MRPERIPTLDELAEDPALAAGLSRNALLALLHTAKRVVLELEYHVAVTAGQTTAASSQDGQEADRRLSPVEAAAYLGVTARWLRSHSVPGKVRLGRLFRYDLRALNRYLRQRAQT